MCVHVCVVGQRSRVFYAALRTGNWGRRIREGGRGTAEMDGWPRREREGREKLRVCDRIETRRVKLPGIRTCNLYSVLCTPYGRYNVRGTVGVLDAQGFRRSGGRVA